MNKNQATFALTAVNELNGSDNLKLYQGDCLEVMKGIKDNSVDMILCDLPY